ncbi:hypothetical protein BT69DRAFT_1259642 [Atractiella rhizophila]|nr:hypothetical protein BT69DRAFT_1259642 [Atractiella rhizophila]
MSGKRVPGLPPSFANSFWTTDYRRGLATLHTKLVAGIAENDEIVQFIRARASQEQAFAASLMSPQGLSGDGFGFDDGAALRNFFVSLQATSEQEGREREKLSKTLEVGIADGFEDWTEQWKLRVAEGADEVGKWLEEYEAAKYQVEHMKKLYEEKTRLSDEANEDARFAGMNSPPSSLTSFPTTTSSPKSNGIKPLNILPALSINGAEKFRNDGPRSAREFGGIIAAKGGFKAFTDRVRGQAAKVNSIMVPNEKLFSDEEEDDGVKRATKEEKGKGKERKEDEKPKDLLEIAGIVKTSEEWSHIFQNARDLVVKQDITVPLLGKYENVHSGEDLLHHFKENLIGLDDSVDKAYEFCRQLVEEMSILRLVGELGNKFYDTHENFYMWKPVAFELHHQARPLQQSTTSSLTSPPISATSSDVGSPTRSASAVSSWYSVVSNVTKAMGPQQEKEPKHEKAAREAEMAEKEYRDGVAKLDKTRLFLEEKIADHLSYMQRLELDRLRAAKSALQAYSSAISSLVTVQQTSRDQCKLMEDVCMPENDIAALIERYKTGNFRPKAYIFENVYHESVNVYYGINLLRWSETKGFTNPFAPVTANGPQRNVGEIPAIVPAMLETLKEGYSKLASDTERRKVWIYEVPLVSTHHVRETVNDVNSAVPLKEALTKYDLPVVASALKLYLLEMDPPLVLYAAYDDVKRVYPNVGAEAQGNRVEAVRKVIAKLPKVHLMVLDAVVAHIGELLETTKTDEDDETYLLKLGFSIGRTIVRPKHESGITVNDRFPALFFADLVKHRIEIMPNLIEHKTKTETEQRKKPIRQRTKLVDARISRSRLGFEGAVPDHNARGALLAERVQNQLNPTKSPPAAEPLVETPIQTVSSPVGVEPDSTQDSTHPPTEERSKSSDESKVEPSEEPIKDDDAGAVTSKEGGKDEDPPLEPFTPPTKKPTINTTTLLRRESDRKGKLKGPRPITPTVTASPMTFDGELPSGKTARRNSFSRTVSEEGPAVSTEATS